MKVLVCGSRHFSDYSHLERVLSGYEISGIVEGEARGADLLGKKYAEERGIPVYSFPADWTKYGKAAGPIRNVQMLKDGRPDLVVAFLAPNSIGTKHMIKIAEKAGIPVNIVNIGV